MVVLGSKEEAGTLGQTLPWLLGGAALILYLATLAPGLVAGDAGELQTAVWSLGVAHPTGYPLYLQAGHLFAALGGAWGLNLLSALSVALATALAVRLILRLSGSIIAAAFVGVLVMFGQQAWFQALSAEVYAPALALQLVSLNLAFDLHVSGKGVTANGEGEGRSDGRFLALLALTYGLSLAHHLSALFLLPALLLLIPWRGLVPRAGWLAAAAFLLGLSTYLYLPLRAVSSSAVNWGDPRTLGAFLEHLRGGDYGTAFFGGTAAGYLGRLGRLALRLVMERGWLILVPILLGLVFSFVERPRWAAALVSWVAAGLFLTAGYAKPDIEAYLLGPVVALALLAGLGFARAGRRFRGRWIGRPLPLVPIAVAGVLFTFHVCNSRARDRLAECFAADFLRTTRFDSQILARTDDLFGALALHETADVRPDVTPLFRFRREACSLTEALRTHRPLYGLLPEYLPGRGLRPTGLGYSYPSPGKEAGGNPPPYLQRCLGPHAEAASRNLAIQIPLSRLAEASLPRPADSAVGHLVTADVIAGSRWQPRARLAETLDVLGLNRLALIYYEEAIGGNPDDAALLGNAGVLAAELDYDELAVEYLKRARELSGPSALAAAENLALHYEFKGYLSEAERAWRWITERLPDEPGAHLNLAANLLGQDRFGEAESAYRRVLELDPAHLDALTGLASLLIGSGRLDEAEGYLTGGQRLAPGSAVVNFNLGLLHRARGELNRAAERFTVAYAADPTMVRALLYRAICTHGAGRYDEAEELYRRCLALMPDDPEVYFHYARLIELSPVGAGDAAILYREFLRLAGPATSREQIEHAEERLARLEEIFPK